MTGVQTCALPIFDAVQSKNVDLVCLSALLTVTMGAMRSTIEALEGAGVRDRVKVIVGGAPVTAQFARDIRADAYGESATSAVAVARRLVAAKGQHEPPRLAP